MGVEGGATSRAPEGRTGGRRTDFITKRIDPTQIMITLDNATYSYCAREASRCPLWFPDAQSLGVAWCLASSPRDVKVAGARETLQGFAGSRLFDAG
jgi:hypothetical protein